MVAMTTINPEELHRVMGGVARAGDAEHDNATRPPSGSDWIKDKQNNPGNGLRVIPEPPGSQPTGQGEVA
jgi:hypothetical protein